MLTSMRSITLLNLILILYFNSLSAQYTGDCFDYSSYGTWGCFLIPRGCKNSDCQFIVKWQNQGTTINFQLATNINIKSGSVFTAYTALGFSKDKLMGDDSVAMCRSSVYAPSMVVETYYNDNEYNSDVLSPYQNDRSVGIINQKVTILNSFLLCNFTRLKAIAGIEKFFNLSNPHYILVAYGKTNSLASPVWHHENAYAGLRPQDFLSLKSTSEGTTNEVQLSTPVQKAHSCLMVLMWILFASTGILVSRYYKFMFYSKICCFNRFWLTLHRSIMVFVLAIVLIAFLLILWDFNWKWVTTDTPVIFAHSIFGIITISLLVIQALFGFIYTLVRTNDSVKKCLHYTHRFVGISTYFLAMVSIFLGVNIDQMNLGRVGWGIMIGWAIWSALLPVIIEIITVDIENLNQSKASKIPDNHPDKENIITENLKKYRSKFNRVKSVLMVMHLIMAIGFSVALVVVISVADGIKFQNS